MIEGIPRSARQHCHSLLTKLILAVVSKSSSEEDWGRLLLFGRMVLDRPVRRKNHNNLTSILSRRCAEFPDDPWNSTVHTPQIITRKRLQRTRRIVQRPSFPMILILFHYWKDFQNRHWRTQEVSLNYLCVDVDVVDDDWLVIITHFLLMIVFRQDAPAP